MYYVSISDLLKIAKNITPSPFVAIPLTPLPNMTAPMYSPGRIPAKPNTDA